MLNSVQGKSEQRSREARTQARHQDLQARLLAAAEAMIVADGLPALRARGLAAAVGCSVGAIYGVFPDLDALILLVNGRTLDSIAAAVLAVPQHAHPAAHLVGLANAYLDYAAAHRLRWEALFQHRMTDGRSIPEDYAAKQAAVFRFIEQPLVQLSPNLSDEQRALAARTLFSAVHGVVQLGLDGKVVALPLPVLREQMRWIIEAVAEGLQVKVPG